MDEQIQRTTSAAVKSLFSIDTAASLSRPNEQFGDYSTNVAMRLAMKLHKEPMDIAETLGQELRKALGTKAQVSIISPGFINFTLSDQALLASLQNEASKHLNGKTIVVEYSDPNPFKVLHAGHLYTSVVGDAIANLLEAAGGQVHRVNFGGDVGMHVAKTIWAMEHELTDAKFEELSKRSIDERAEWMAKCYIEGSQKYDADDEAKTEIGLINKDIYKIQETKDQVSPRARLYWTTRDWSYEYFKKFYEQIGSKFEKFYTESEVQALGVKTVLEQLKKGVYEKSNGAVVFPGEKYGLHTRVFINSEGLPTYEAKDVGLIIQKHQDYNFDQSIIITANEQEQYMAVVQKSIEQFAPDLVKGSTHLTHGLVRLLGGEKMSSRKGNILRATDVVDAARQENAKLNNENNEQIVLGAIKYAFLKTRMGGDIMYDPVESVSIEGNSGPYLQYAYARAKSIIKKIGDVADIPDQADIKLNPSERSLLRKISEFPEVVTQATAELMPHHICTYLYELAQNFNRFYELNQVIGDDRQNIRAYLVKSYVKRLKAGLDLLGISAPEHV